jgi:hypothetical protein
MHDSQVTLVNVFQGDAWWSTEEFYYFYWEEVLRTSLIIVSVLRFRSLILLDWIISELTRYAAEGITLKHKQ